MSSLSLNRKRKATSNLDKECDAVKSASVPSDNSIEPTPTPPALAPRVSLLSSLIEVGFDSLNDDMLYQILLYAGKKSFNPFGILNKRCHAVFISKNLPKETFMYGYAPLPMIQASVGEDSTVNETNGHNTQTGWNLGKAVVYYNRRDILQWALREGKTEVLISACDYASEVGRIDTLKKIKNSVGDEAFTSTCTKYTPSTTHAALNGKLDTLKWLLNNNCSIEAYSCMNNAAGYGHLHVLKWLMKELEPSECCLTEEVFGYAAEGAHFHVMEWLWENKCPFDAETFSLAAAGGNISVLEWLLDKKCPWDNDSYAAAGSGEHLDVLKWLKEKGCPRGNNILKAYYAGGWFLCDSEVEDWLNENEFILDDNAWR